MLSYFDKKEVVKLQSRAEAAEEKVRKLRIFVANVFTQDGSLEGMRKGAARILDETAEEARKGKS